MADRKVEVDVGAWVPPELEPLVIRVNRGRHARPVTNNIPYSPVLDIDMDSSGTPGDEGGTDNNALDTPNSFTVVDQQVRVAPDGTQFIDIVVDIGDVSGAESYEVRLVKV